jgi:WD40 repeat protein
LRTGETVATHGLSQGVTGNGFVSANGNYFAFGSASGGIELLTSTLKEAAGTLTPKGAPGAAVDFKCTAAAMSADGKHAAAGRPNGKLFLFTVEGSEQQSDLPLKGHDGAVDGVAFTKEGLVSLGRDGKLKWWDLEGKETGVHSFESPLYRGWLLAEGQVAAIVRKPGIGVIQLHRLPAKAGEATKLIGTINIVDVFDGFPLFNRELETQHLALAPNGKYLAAAIQAGQADITNARVALYDVGDIMPKLTPPATSVATVDKPINTPNDTPKTTPAPKPENQARTWKTADGMFSVEASLVSFANGTVKLKRSDNGKVISVPLKNLSLEDQDYMRRKR